ncbi:peptidoglycan DD-metalloendopeptidase family protein [Guyparkeria hydrothermalis]|uniref:murein hydrolase activator EnvC family protein n=1 Tax=Guyparkeria hydrothermalis TaxID=923 RepID=UPI002020D463|nr:peptidoglycan DD-metalloendopeptidase family protein [Guyparkeria hydrothermalis]MCL7744943.1 peptidoglycan DD-metalloendopeptidase family protein [Guyparkeria hydrothermalis]
MAPSAEPIEEQIEAQRATIASTESERKAAREALAAQQKRLAFLEKKTAELDAERAELEERQQALAEREEQLLRGLARRKAELERRLRAAYPLTRGSALQTLLSDGDALQAERDLHYLRNLIRPVQEARRALEAQRVELADNREAVAETERSLAQAGERLETHYEDVRENLDEQERLLASLGETLDEQQQSLKSMLERKRRLDREVAAARAASKREAEKAAREEKRASAGPAVTTDGIPVAGEIKRNFGESLPQGRLRNEGVEFRAAAGSPVRAVDGGKVAYAGPLKGFGNLVMVRHQGDYLSLYAHCRSLAVSKGQQVSQGEQVCDSGRIDANREGLYVEVRRGNRPIDPTRWPAWKKVVGG